MRPTREIVMSVSGIRSGINETIVGKVTPGMVLKV
jgi:hypothetical protein